MMVIRPIRADDWDALRALSRKTGPGFTSLQDDEVQTRGKLDAGLAAFNANTAPQDALYLFVLEDTASGQVVGCSAIEAAVGLDQPWYNYRVGTLVHASRELQVYNRINTLTISNDHTGCSELCTLFLDPDFRHGKNGHLLSKSRFLFLAEFPERFDQRLIAEMRGYSDAQGISPFWEGLGRHFFSLDFAEADRLSARDKVFIAELMPKHTIYTNLLPESARQVISHTHDNTTPARKLLEAEGLRYTGYVDIFDAGPLLEAPVNEIRAVRESRYAKTLIDTHAGAGEPFLVATPRFEGFRCCLTPLNVDHNIARLTPEVAAALQVDNGDPVRVVPLSASRRF
ncbi:arginine N-succinyltransferase [Motiliproteus sediminis]|uniref:arginine N-succinyltransferase n=1 Tax=Motiliproteus sediminis TaxID=1468178 RepID=UPI001AEFE913|nr:arginine N-succinyltransferase [Motiliproteus sediminis]